MDSKTSEDVIALTTVMFTVLMTIFSSISDSQQKEEMRLNGSTSFATIKYISDDDYGILQRAFGNGNVGYRLFISSQINNESLSGQPIEMSYMDENYMLTHFCTPSVGTVPMKKMKLYMTVKFWKKWGRRRKLETRYL